MPSLKQVVPEEKLYRSTAFLGMHPNHAKESRWHRRDEIVGEKTTESTTFLMVAISNKSIKTKAVNLRQKLLI